MSRSRWAAAAATVVALTLPGGLALADANAASTSPLQTATTVNRTAASASSGPSGPASTPVPVLASGAGFQSAGGSASVRDLQRRLSGAGDSPGAIDGLYGPQTAQAVVRFEHSHGLAADGVAGPRTLAALNTPVATVRPPAQSTNLPSAGGSASVRDLQRRLFRAGAAPGPIDGRYGLLTAQAVMRFQWVAGLPVDGVADHRTLARLARVIQPVSVNVVKPSNRGQRPTATTAFQAAAVGGVRKVSAPNRSASKSRGSHSALWLLALVVAGLSILIANAARVRRRRSNVTRRPAHQVVAPLPQVAGQDSPAQPALVVDHDAVSTNGMPETGVPAVAVESPSERELAEPVESQPVVQPVPNGMPTTVNGASGASGWRAEVLRRAERQTKNPGPIGRVLISAVVTAAKSDRDVGSWRTQAMRLAARMGQSAGPRAPQGGGGRATQEELPTPQAIEPGGRFQREAAEPAPVAPPS